MKYFKTVFIFLCLIVNLNAEPIFSKLAITQSGQLEYLIVHIEPYDLLIDSHGHLMNVTIVTESNLDIQYRITNHKVEKVNQITVDYKFMEAGELRFFGDTEIVFSMIYPGIIESIGDLKFEYYDYGKGPEEIKSIDEIEFIYRYPDNLVEAIGDATFEYNLLYGEKIELIEGEINPYNPVEIIIQTKLVKNYYPKKSQIPKKPSEKE